MTDTSYDGAEGVDLASPSSEPSVTQREGSTMPHFPPWGVLLVAWTLRAAVLVTVGIAAAEGLLPAGVVAAAGPWTLAAVAVVSGALPYASRRFAVRRMLRGRGPLTRYLTLLFAIAFLVVADAARRGTDPLVLAATAGGHLVGSVLVFGLLGLLLGWFLGSATWGTGLGVLGGIGAVLTAHGPPSIAAVTAGLPSPWFGWIPGPAGATLDAVLAVSAAVTLLIGVAYGLYLGLYGNYRDELEGDRLTVAPVTELLVLAPLAGLVWIEVVGGPVSIGGLAVGLPGFFALLTAGALGECLLASLVPGRMGE